MKAARACASAVVVLSAALSPPAAHAEPAPPTSSRTVGIHRTTTLCRPGPGPCVREITRTTVVFAVVSFRADGSWR
ncbi:hypothetical protein [Amycolatopsis sp. cmx-4-68]|uniref:hypothetical protein n=1 Tax=Amycolatopsis sp. cmx-4-68 TaxID=2790938 RepID=UPI00397AD694